MGCYVAIGGRDETAALAGASHFLEHLLFKGTATRSAHEIAEAVDARGGELNAFTAQEHTAFFTRLPSRELTFAIDLLADVVTVPAFRPEEVDSERQVILEELSLSEDEPDERAHTLCMEALFPGHPLGREVLGSRDTIEAMTRDQIAGFHAEHYRAANLVVVAAGDLDHDTLTARVDSRFGAVLAEGARPTRTAPSARPVPLAVLRRPTEQAHLVLGWRTFDLHHPDRYPLAVLNQVLGSGMSSRLFQEIRERRGLAYSVYSYSSLYSDAGALMVYAGTAPSRLAEVRALIVTEVDRLLADGVTEHELGVAKGYLEGSLVLGLEDSGSRMARLGSNLIARGEVTAVDQHLERIAAVTGADVDRVIAGVLSEPATLAAVGRLHGAT
ncbi:MAG: pitrilysin family protein [Acidimicrobiales bacterium]